MSLESERFAKVATLDRWVLDAILAAWSGLDLTDLQGSFTGDVLPVALDAMLQGQYEAADIGADYADAAAVRDAVDPGPRVKRAEFVGVASDGRSLPGLFAQPLVNLFQSLAVGVREPVALAASRNSLDEILTTQIQDTARAAEETALAANFNMAGYVRFVEPGACSRCIVLAGRFYKWNAGFDRHPRCRCSHKLQATNTVPQDPREHFDKLSTAEQDKVFTKDGAESIRQGADVGQVVNARRGMTTATIGGRTVQTTIEGTTKRGYAAYMRRAIDEERGTVTKFRKGTQSRYRRVDHPRLMPEEIIRLSKGDRVESRRLLISNGYIVGNIRALAREATGK